MKPSRVFRSAHRRDVRDGQSDGLHRPTTALRRTTSRTAIPVTTVASANGRSMLVGLVQNAGQRPGRTPNGKVVAPRSALRSFSVDREFACGRGDAGRIAPAVDAHAWVVIA